MAVGDIGVWRDSAGGQIPGTSWGTFETATQVQNDNGNYTWSALTPYRYTLGPGEYLFVVNIRTNDTSNGRFNLKAAITINSGTADLWTSYYSGYSRDSSEDDAFVRVLAYAKVTSSTEFDIKWKRDTDVPIGGSVVDASFVQIVQIQSQAVSIYRGNNETGQTYGGTSWNQVEIGYTALESDTSSISRSSNVVTIKKTARYLIMYCVGFDSATTRTQRVGSLKIAGSTDEGTKSYAYMRNSNNEFGGLGGATIVDNTSATTTVEIQAYRGAGVLADQGGADSDGNATHIFSETGMCVIELPSTVEVFKSYDQTGLQVVTGTTKISHNIVNTVDFNDSASFTKNDATSVNTLKSCNVFVWANIWTARQTVSAGTRLTCIANIDITGTDKTEGLHGNYSRGNQSTIDTFGCSFHPGGIYAVTNSDRVSVESVRIPGGEAGGNDRTQPYGSSLILLNLDTFSSTNVNISTTVSSSISTNTPSISRVVSISSTAGISLSTNTPGVSLLTDLSTSVALSIGTDSPTLNTLISLGNSIALSISTDTPKLYSLIGISSTVSMSVNTNSPTLYSLIKLGSSIAIGVSVSTPDLNTAITLSSNVSTGITTTTFILSAGNTITCSVSLSIGSDTSGLVSSSSISSSISASVVTNSPEISSLTGISSLVAINISTTAPTLQSLIGITTSVGMDISTSSFALESGDSLLTLVAISLNTSTLNLLSDIDFSSTIALDVNTGTFNFASLIDLVSAIALSLTSGNVGIKLITPLSSSVGLSLTTNNPDITTAIPLGTTTDMNLLTENVSVNLNTKLSLSASLSIGSDAPVIALSTQISVSQALSLITSIADLTTALPASTTVLIALQTNTPPFLRTIDLLVSVAIDVNVNSPELQTGSIISLSTLVATDLSTNIPGIINLTNISVSIVLILQTNTPTIYRLTDLSSNVSMALQTNTSLLYRLIQLLNTVILSVVTNTPELRLPLLFQPSNQVDLNILTSDNANLIQLVPFKPIIVTHEGDIIINEIIII